MLERATLVFGQYRIAMNMIILKQSFYRIIDLDVEERNKRDSEAASASSKKAKAK